MTMGGVGQWMFTSALPKFLYRMELKLQKYFHHVAIAALVSLTPEHSNRVILGHQIQIQIDNISKHGLILHKNIVPVVHLPRCAPAYFLSCSTKISKADETRPNSKFSKGLL